MRVFWWQGGVHIEPETDEQRTLLVGLLAALDAVRIGHEVVPSGIRAIEFTDQQPVVGIHELP